MEKIKYLASWDSKGLECLFNISEWEKKLTWTTLQDAPMPECPNPKILIMRAMANPQRRPEIYIFETDGLEEDTVREAFEETPQFMADFIRVNGYKLYSSREAKDTDVIK